MPRRIRPGGPFVVTPLPLGPDLSNVGPQGGRGQVLNFLQPYRVRTYLWPDEELPPAVAPAAPEDESFVLSVRAAGFPPQVASFADSADELLPSIKLDDDQRYDSPFRGYPQVQPFVGDDDAQMASIGTDDDQRYDSAFKGYQQVLPFFDRADDLVTSIFVDDDQRFDSAFQPYKWVPAFLADDDAWMAFTSVDDDGQPPAPRAALLPGGWLILFDDGDLPPAAAAATLEDDSALPARPAQMVQPGWTALFDDGDLPPQAAAAALEDDSAMPGLPSQVARPGRSTVFDEEALPPSAPPDDDPGLHRLRGYSVPFVPLIAFDEEAAAILRFDDEGHWSLRAAPGWTAPGRSALFEDEFFIQQLGLLVEDLRFLAADYGRPFLVVDLINRFLAADYGRPLSVNDDKNRFLAADEQRNFIGIDPEPMGAKVSFDVKFTPEIVTLTFPFTNELLGATISVGTPTVAVTTVVGTDASPTNLLNGAPQISAGLVLQSVKAGLDACSYHFVCQVDLSDGRRLVRTGTLQVKAP